MRSKIKNKALGILLAPVMVLALLTAFPAASAVTPITPEMPVNPFSDVFGSDWFIDAVIYVFDKDLMVGVSDDLFEPGEDLSRAMTVTILYRHAGEPDVSDLGNPFDDVAENTWYTDAVKWAYANEIVMGYGGGVFGANDHVTKEQLAVLIYRTQQSSGEIPMDILMDYEHSDWNDISDWAKSAVTKLTMQGVFRDIPGSAFDPQAPATRAEVASMLHRYLSAVE
ncbi:MAG: S-layer homology domain-containing protein [Oscillospiraceae bacterium]|nr:S-layer homology domain-containing protein [Oscillospiraceae bacterium]